MAKTAKFKSIQHVGLTEEDDKGLDELCLVFNKARPEMMRELLRSAYSKLRINKAKETLKENA